MSPTPVRIGLVGAGGIAVAHLPGLLRLGPVTVFAHAGAQQLADANADAARAAGTSITVVDSLQELFDAVDVVDVVTPTATHAQVVRAALAAGKDVVSEKPLARTDADAADLVRCARDAGRQLVPAHVVRFFPAYVRLHEAVTTGLLGDLAVLRFVRSGAFPIRTPWFADHALSGGIVLDQMIHDLDIARWVAGEVTDVSAVRVRSGTADEPVEAAHVLLTHASGAISHVAGIWGPQHLPFTTEYAVTGTRGSLSHRSRDELDLRADLAVPGDVDGFLPAIDPADDPYAAELAEFIGSFRGGPAARVTAEDGAAAVRIANAAITSIETGQPVVLS
ncbi:Gfo/Idh/MocA family oxidoreductase [Curtobacterium sp. MCLR17_007]|uniref:Gfo/Idh/MocA family protein n=1 Tax=unclassified Curtobacterium TaxID=257496 RepID=UPI0006FE43B2|nr:MULTISPECIES: Gfo/Idh/MocA family oxidoreductase [unclassified Curtobacterium]KQS06131.1 dehydrogenase [Curtobacterium sp. Leaf183]WIB60462.1 Gfo/Idh/MocA family oxidoreductase [Curtobacterium sp. MCLR17_007]